MLWLDLAKTTASCDSPAGWRGLNEPVGIGAPAGRLNFHRPIDLSPLKCMSGRLSFRGVPHPILISMRVKHAHVKWGVVYRIVDDEAGGSSTKASVTIEFFR